MPERRTLVLSAQERQTLIWSRDREPRPYLREQAAALLKIADGQSPHAVARQGLLRCRDPDTVYGWLDYYEEHRKLRVRPPCRRRFSP